jgi:hypothetical protein
MNSIIYRYPLDPTGVSPDNLVTGEEHQLSTRTIRCIAPIYGGFFSDSVLVRDLDTGNTLIRGIDYQFGELFEFPTGRYGKEVFGIIAISKPNVSRVSISYQTLGGNYSYSMDAIIAMIDSLDIGDRPVNWGSLIDRPTLFEPATHWHDIGDVYGFEYLVHAVEQLRNAILIGDVASHDEIYLYMDRLAAEQALVIASVLKVANDHIADKNNPHVVTKAQVGLSLVENYSIATQPVMDAGSSNTAYLTPVTVYKHVTDRAVTPLSNHVGDKNNPHAVTKVQTGLGNVENYGISTTAEATAGTSNVVYMTPLRVKEAIALQAGAVLTTHTGDVNNPHATTKAQVGLSLVENYTLSTEPQATAGLINTAYMTPLRTKEAIGKIAGDMLAVHTVLTNNPHGVTKAQVGLGNVENYTIATQTQVDAGAVNNVYVTPGTVYKLITDRAVTPLSNHAGNISNPHAVTKAQVGLGSVENYGMATDAQAIAGAAGNAYMTPSTVRQAITSQAGALLASHTTLVNNPHAVTKLQVGLGNVLNYPCATQAEAQAGTVDTAFMTPLRVKEAIAFQVGAATAGHTSDMNNPHSVTKAQVGLSLVENYGMATVAQAIAGAVGNLYMSPQSTKQAIESQARSLLEAHTTLVNNPHAVTKTQVGLGNVDNTSDVNKPISTAMGAALSGKEGTITAGTTLQYYRGDKTWTAFPTSMPASDVSSWAKAATKPSYTAGEVGAEGTIAVGTALQYLRGDKTWATFPTLAAAGYDYISPLLPLPAANITQFVNHGLGQLPEEYSVSLICISADIGFTAGTCVDITGLFDGDGDRRFTTWSTPGEIAYRTIGNPIYIVSPGTVVPINQAKWRLQFKAKRGPVRPPVGEYTIFINSNTTSFNLRDAAIAQGYDGFSSFISITVVIGIGVVVGSAIQGGYAFDTGVGWPAATDTANKIIINNWGYIVGKGGNGSQHVSGWNDRHSPAYLSGPALIARTKITIMNAGTIAKGGGGGWSVYVPAGYSNSGLYNGGGGGAGYNVGVGGGLGGASGTLTTGGTATGGAGAGGNLGVAGYVETESGQTIYSITGNNFITWTANGSVLGPVI